jgi:hypothetical protein
MKYLAPQASTVTKSGTQEVLDSPLITETRSVSKMLLLKSAGPLFLTISSVVLHIKEHTDDESKYIDGMERSNKVRTCGNPSTEGGSHDVTGPNCEDDGAKPPNLAQQKKRRVVVSERRRMQNRQAQKLYSR